MSSSLDEFIKTCGRVEAFSAFKPHSKAGLYHHINNARKLLNISGNGPDSILVIYELAQACIIPPKNIVGEIKERATVETIRECPFSKGSIDFCMFYSHFGSQTICDLVNPEYESIVTHHLINSDPYCRLVFKKKTDPVTVLDDPGKTLFTLPTIDLPKDQAYAGHLAFDSTQLHIISSAFADLRDPEQTTLVLMKNAKEVGRDMGKRLLEARPDLGTNEESIEKLVESLGKLILQEGTCIKGQGNQFEKEITSCPFQTFTKDVCHQYEALIQGMLESIDPNYEFSYDRMIPNGDKACHWTLRKKPSAKQVDDPFKILKLRFVKGEISEEEYKRMKAVIE